MKLDATTARMYRKQHINREELISRIRLSVGDFSSVLADLQMEELSSEDAHVAPESAVTGVVNFEGAYRGYVWASCSRSLASHMAERQTGCHGESHADPVGQLVGEMVNILGGELRLFLSPADRKIELSPPTVYHDDQEEFSDWTSDPNRLCCAFQHGEERLQVGVVLKRSLPVPL